MSVTSTFSLTFPNTVMADIHTHWTDLSAAIGVLATPVLATDTVINVTLAAYASAYGTAQQPAVGTCVLIDQEPMLVTAITLSTGVGNATTLTVTRGATISPLAVPATHAVTSSVKLLQYANPYKMIAMENILPGVRKISIDLAERSAVFGYTVTGSTVVIS